MVRWQPFHAKQGLGVEVDVSKHLCLKRLCVKASVQEFVCVCVFFFLRSLFQIQGLRALQYQFGKDIGLGEVLLEKSTNPEYAEAQKFNDGELSAPCLSAECMTSSHGSNGNLYMCK